MEIQHFIGMALSNSVVTGVLVGVLMSYWNRQQKKRTDRHDRREEDRIDRELVQLDLNLASAQLSYAVAMAVKRGQPNGEIEEGIKQYEKAMRAFRRFERTQLAKSE